MKKKFFGIKIGKILFALACLVLAVVFWFAVKYDLLDASSLSNIIFG